MLNPSDQDDFLVVCHPSDADFENGVRLAIESSQDVAEAVELRLHDRYPDLRIVVHEPLGAAGAAQPTIWIVFRDRDQRADLGAAEPRRAGDDPGQSSDQPVAMVVDDEPVVLQLVCAILESRGWRVLRATDSEDALVQAEGIDLDLLVTDHDLVGIDGPTLARLLCDRRPTLPVLVVSGRPETIDPILKANFEFLAKPFGVEELAVRVAALTGHPTVLHHQESSQG
jgi:CheY-like chemotaxis protein